MSRRRQVEGVCSICGREGPLTFEHVPPQAAFNKSKVLTCSGFDYLKRDPENLPWEMKGVRETVEQGGAGGYTLCERCNNTTGAWYARDYVHFVECAMQSKDHPSLLHVEGAPFVFMQFEHVYLLRIIKQVLAMFASVCGPGLANANPELRRLVLGKDERGLNPDHVGIYCYAWQGEMQRRAGVSGWMGLTGSSWRERVLAEFSTIPFGFVLEFAPHGGTGLWDITDFANQFSYDDSAAFSWLVPIRENNTIFPGDFRTRQQVLDTYLENQAKKQTGQGDTS